MKYKYKMTTTTLRCDDVSRADWRFVIRRSVHILSPPSTLTCESNDMNGAIIVPAQFSYRHRGKIDHCSSTIMTLLSMVHLQSSPTAAATGTGTGWWRRAPPPTGSSTGHFPPLFSPAYLASRHSTLLTFHVVRRRTPSARLASSLASFRLFHVVFHKYS